MNPSFPVIRLSNARLSVGLYLPDYAQGYYRGTRFDHAGIIYDLRYEGHAYCGEWFDRHDPYRHDGICGPVDEFTVIGYDDASVCHSREEDQCEFLKIGVGTLRKVSEAPYDRFQLYEIVHPGVWSVEAEEDAVHFTQVLTAPKYAYEYTKTIRLNPHKPAFQIEYILKNNGPSSLNTSVYNHNFFTLDHAVTGPDIEISFPFAPVGEWREPHTQVKTEGNRIRFLRDIAKEESVFMGHLGGFDPKAEGYRFELKNKRTGAGVAVKGSGRLSNIVFWASYRVPCVEPYTDLTIDPGKEARWTIEYTLSC